ncbi:MAG: hypothetical protein JWM85_276 [Acidimicrobiaceae bacterium]|nr:hypothetical protein [Acidimicrobiaceae bacterium]
MVQLVRLLDRLNAEGELRLASFTSEELVAVGADSPLQGLVISERLAALGPIPLTAALSAALRSLVARGFVHPEGTDLSAAGPGFGSPDRHGPERFGQGEFDVGGFDEEELDEELTVEIPLSGDLAVVVALRRSPAVVAVAFAPRPTDRNAPPRWGLHRAQAILHGFAAEPEGALGILEERRSPLGIHAFVLRTLADETAVLAGQLALLLETPSEQLASVDAWAFDLEVAVPAGDEDDAGDEDELGTEERRRITAVLEGGEIPRALLQIWPDEGEGEPATEELSPDKLASRLAEVLADAWRELGGDGSDRWPDTD